MIRAVPESDTFIALCNGKLYAFNTNLETSAWKLPDLSSVNAFIIERVKPFKLVVAKKRHVHIYRYIDLAFKGKGVNVQVQPTPTRWARI